MSKMISTWRTRLEKRGRYLRTLKELNAMDDCEVEDLGLNRDNFRQTAWNAVYGG